MRIVPLCLLAIAASWPTPASAAIRNFGVSSFERVRIEGPYKVHLKTGVAPFARAIGSPVALDRVAIDVRGTTLIVHAGLSVPGGYPGSDSGPVEIELGTHDLNAVALAGSGSLTIDKIKGLRFDLSVQGSGMADVASVAVDQLSVNLGGSAAARLAGKSAQMNAVLRGMTVLDATELDITDAAFGAEGPATIKATVTKSVKIDGSGAATFIFAGRPSCTNRLKGSATVEGCK